MADIAESSVEVIDEVSVVPRVTKKKKFIASGLFFAELNEFLKRRLAEQGFAGVEVRVTPKSTQIIIRATRPDEVLGDKGQRIRELTSLIQKRFGFSKSNPVELFADRVSSKGLSAMAQCESLKFKLSSGLAVRRACYSIVRYVMEAGARGVEVVVSGKLRAQRAKAMKFKDGYMIKTGNAVNQFVESAIRHVYMRQGVLGVKVSIMLPDEEVARRYQNVVQPDTVRVLEPKEDFPVAAEPAVARAQ